MVVPHKRRLTTAWDCCIRQYWRIIHFLKKEGLPEGSSIALSLGPSYMKQSQKRLLGTWSLPAVPCGVPRADYLPNATTSCPWLSLLVGTMSEKPTVNKRSGLLVGFAPTALLPRLKSSRRLRRRAERFVPISFNGLSVNRLLSTASVQQKVSVER